MTRLRLLISSLIPMLLSVSLFAQKMDSTVDNLQKIPTKYIDGIDKKITKYSNRITGKTEKTLTKLSRWENKIRGLLQKTDPEAADRLFNNQLTFTSLLQKVKDGESIALQYQAPYNKYQDEVTTSLKYLAEQKELLDSSMTKKAKETGEKMKVLSVAEVNSEALQQFIKERKKQLFEQTINFVGHSKYLAKINKEAYYYTETLKNYKELFSDSKKAEETAKAILNRVPAFRQFMQNNSQMAVLFGGSAGIGNTASLAGLQTRAGLQNLLQQRIAAGGPNVMQELQQNIQDAKNQINGLKEKMLAKLPGAKGGGDMPDFKPNDQKTKTFKQRLEYGFNMQFAKNNILLPTTSDMALSIGYKLNNNSTAGAAAVYKLGMGSIQHIRFTHQGIGIRSFIDWKLKKHIYISGGYELNHNAQFKNIEQLKSYDAWQRSALIGLTKRIEVNTKLFKATNVQLLYDFLSQQHVPISQPVMLRMGYNF